MRASGAFRVCLAFLVCLAVCGLSYSATLWVVRPDGSDADCTGVVDANSVDAPDCAFATISHAFETTITGQRAAGFSCSAGDDVTVAAGTFAENVSFPTSCSGASNGSEVLGEAGRVVLDGVGATTVVGLGSGESSIFLGNSSSGARHKNITIRQMKVKAGTRAAIGCRESGTAAARYCSEVTIEDVTFSDLSALTLGADSASTPNAIIQFPFEGTSNDDNILLQRLTIDGDESNCVSLVTSPAGVRACGSNATAVYAQGPNTILQDSTARDLQGQFARLGRKAIIQGNTLTNVWGRGDDGVIQVYNNPHIIVRRNVFNGVMAVDTSYGVVRMRRRNDQAATPSMAVYNNTFIAPADTCSGPTDSCDANTIGSAINRVAVRNNKGDLAARQGEMSVYRNIFVGYGGANFRAIHIDGTSCPEPLRVWSNLFYDNDGTILGSASCPAIFMDDPNAPQANPTLTDFEPAFPGPCCTPPGPEYTAWDGDVTSPWVGALAGDCPYCGDATANNGEECDGSSFRGDDPNCAVWPSCLGSAGLITCNASCTANIQACVNCGTGIFDCRDGVKNNAETATDCGGGVCQRCYAGAACTAATDCASGVCTDSVCVGTGGRPPGKQQDTGGNN